MAVAGGYLYFLASAPNGILYGCYKQPCPKNLRTSEWINRRIYQKIFSQAARYFEHYEEIRAAIQREHNIKHWSRKWKVRLILANNPEWNDLYDSITKECGWTGQARHEDVKMVKRPRARP